MLEEIVAANQLDDDAAAPSRRSKRRLRTRIKKAVATVLVVLLVAMITLVVQRPWVVAAVREGYPSNTWPADGNFVTQGDVTASAALLGASTDSTSASNSTSPEFDKSFAESGGMAFVVADHGEIVFSHYAEGYSASTEFNSFSMVKGLVGVLTIKAISDGDIASLDVTIGQLWPRAADTEIADVPIGDLLDMTSGIAFEKDPGQVGNVSGAKKDQVATFSPISSMSQLHVVGIDAVVDEATLIKADRGLFSYQNFNTAVLGRILEEVYGTSLDQLLHDKIAKPAGAGGFRWRQYSSADRVSAYCCLYATTQWWVQVAQFIMNNGVGNPGDAFVSDDWHAYLTGDQFTADELFDGEYRSQLRYNILDRDGEGLQGPFVYFSGLGGQTVYLVPDSDLVIVRFGERQQLLHTTLYQTSDLG